MADLFRFGLLPAVVAVGSFQVLLRVPMTVDLSSWYAGSTLLGLGVLLAIFGYGFYTSLAGQPIFRDPLQVHGVKS